MKTGAQMEYQAERERILLKQNVCFEKDAVVNLSVMDLPAFLGTTKSQNIMAVVLLFA